jgi:anthranilate synthase component 1
MSSVYPSRSEFKELTKKGNLIPVYREIVADMDTPVSAFKKLEDSECAYLLESVEGGEKWARYSFIGLHPLVSFKSKRHDVEILYANGKKESFSDSAPLDRLKEIMKNYLPVEDSALPPFSGGAVGYVSYDEVRNFEPVGGGNNDDLNLPDTYFVITESLVVFDHLRHRMKLVVNVHLQEGEDIDALYDDALQKINQLHQKLMRSITVADRTVSVGRCEIKSNLTQDQFMDAVERCKEYIAAGDVFQVVISQRFNVTVTCEPFEIYRALRSVNPSPYMFYLKFKDMRLVGASPEILVRLNGDVVQVRPIAGTRKRGATPEEDIALENELLADPKERAEHIMLVDLGRNDCGRVCEYGTVNVDDLMTIERYSHVMHIVSNVSGKLKTGTDAFDVFRAAFPAGTVSGAPKIRAMQIIDEVEQLNRGTYAGSVGYFGFNGNLDSCITIRTILIKGEQAYVQAGAGIVADSDPLSEYRETINKASAMIRAIEIAEYGLD